ncbi:hypothetical protein [Emticicia sp. TH156]|uniref:hypothetical protein n=1 Tax=Emticicia sp. TH156 TaxID=2067454 RepID=UPI000CA65F81|nr:hypothetical protein [Emticicia sp. TH156]PLK44320.1 hypothetical protein C0V77_11035 [Emticicia sp. TH156]
MRTITTFLLIMMLFTAATCADSDGYSGVIEGIENGKDGYVATLKDENGKRFEALFSIPNMGPDQFKRWQVGDRLNLEGDTIHINQTYRVIARKAEKK